MDCIVINTEQGAFASPTKHEARKLMRESLKNRKNISTNVAYSVEIKVQIFARMKKPSESWS